MMTTTTTTTPVNVANPKCTAEKLEAFYNDHFTYINQFFGDITVRDIIHEMYPSQHKYDFAVESAKNGGGLHHVLMHGTRKICSVDLGIQNTNKDENDTLCQSYSLLWFMDQPIPKIEKDDTLEEELFKKKSRQMQMIRMYRDLMKNKGFTREVTKVIQGMQDTMNEYPRGKLPAEKVNEVWMDYTQKPLKRGVRPYMNLDTLFANIRKTLNDWEAFGYWYFIRKGECPPIVVAKSKSKSATITQKRKRSLTPSPRRTRSQGKGGV